jgi:C4-dicarboxylate-specific signal transduction histidine kinase
MPEERFAGTVVSDLPGAVLFERTLRPNLDHCFSGEEITFAGWFDDRPGRLYLVVTCSPLRAGTELVDAALVITHDLTDQMRATEELQAAQAELAHVSRMSTLGELAASIAHEINQPLAAIVNAASAGLRWLDGQPPDIFETRQMLARIVKDGNRAAEVIGRVRALARKSPVRMEQIAINEVVAEVIALARTEIDRNRVALHTPLADHLPPIQGDRVQLQQVFLNLVVNAIEAMRDNEERELIISTGNYDPESVIVSVRDSGPGLDPQTVDRIFQSFFTTKPSGMGMGLSICRSIVEAHGGRLSARPNEPRGAIFEVALPREQSQGNTAGEATKAVRSIPSYSR